MRTSIAIAGICAVLIGFVSFGAQFGIFTTAGSTAQSVMSAVARSWENARTSASIQRKIRKLGNKPVMNMPVPVLFGVAPSAVYDSWGDPRSGGRRHEGTDIMAPRGAFIVSPTKAVVTAIGYGENGGNYVYTANPGGERFYYAHLDSIPKHVKPGLELEVGDLIGYVGNTGNASAGAPHLHLGIYKRGATNPYPRLTKEFTALERTEAVERMIALIDEPKERIAFAKRMVAEQGAVLREAVRQKVKLSKTLSVALAGNPTGGSTPAKRDLGVGASGSEVVWLQEFLIAQNKGVAARLLKVSGATGTFGAVTQTALAEYQAAVGIAATGYFGPATRAHVTQIAAATPASP